MMITVGDPGDPLLSVDEIARLWSVGPAIVAELVGGGRLPSLDGGGVVRSGRLDVPCSRLAWADALRVDSPGAARRIDEPYAGFLHPAATIAGQMHVALIDDDADAIWALSSAESHEIAHSPNQLLRLWDLALPDARGDDVGVSTGVYKLSPHPGVGVRLMISPTPVHRFDRPTWIHSAGLIPLIEEDGFWRAHLPLAQADVDWGPLLLSAPP